MPVTPPIRAAAARDEVCFWRHGSVALPETPALRPTAAGSRRTCEEWAGEKIRQVVPLGCWQVPEDMADMAVFLSSERADQITGQTINVDGGFVMHW